MTYDCSSVSSCNVTLPGPSLQSLCAAAEYICFMSHLDKMIRNNPEISRKCERVKPIDEPAKEYDFIVAGGGGGGAVVAGRLAEITGWTILLLEAGKDESAAGRIPGFVETLKGSEIDWNYHTSNESHACLSTNGSCSWASARSLGGNTAHNEMIYLRGNPTDFEKWVELGNVDWEWEKVLKYYKMQEDNANIDEVGYDYHSTGGPLSVGKFPYVSPLAKRLLKALEQSGFRISKSLNANNFSGSAIIQATQKNGVRVSSATAYLQPHRDGANLHVSLNSYVTRIIIENEKAVGIEYRKNGKLKIVRARKEVIVSMGTIRSPQILHLSGIGPKKHLEFHDIDVIVDLPGVGENLHDHVAYLLSMTLNEADTYSSNVRVAKQYLKNQTGPMSASDDSYVVGMGFTNRTTADYPDIQLGFMGNEAGCAPGKIGALRSEGKRKITAIAVNLHPQSRGRISLASSDPFDYPVIWANYLSEKIDEEVLVDSIEVMMNLLKSKALQERNFTLFETPAEACSNYTIPSREYWACAVHYRTSTIWHPVGTCKMGPASDPMAVVDPRLRVHGIKNLRVVDASIMPQITSSNTAAPTMMIGERGADFIKKTWLPSSVWPADAGEDFCEMSGRTD